MRITYLHQFFRLPSQGGGIRSYEMARRWAAEGHDVTIITSDMTGERTQIERSTIDGIGVIWLPVAYHQTMNIRARLKSFFGYMIQAGRVAAHEPESDVVLATSTPLTVALPGAYLARRHRAKFVFEVRDLWPEVPIALGALPSAPMRWAARLLERFAYWRADHIVALSPGMAAGVAAAGVESAAISIIPNSADCELFNVPPSAAEQFRAERPHLGHGPLLVYTGTFGAVNDACWLVELMAAVSRIDNHVQLLMIGFGSQEDDIRALAERHGLLARNVHIEGYMSKREIAATLAAADVSFSTVADVPELDHNSANKVFDAFAAGTAVGINHGGWLAELLEGSGAGLQLPRDPAKAAENLCDLLSDHAAMASMRKASSELGRRFDRNWHAAQYLEIMSDLTATGRAEARDLVAVGPDGPA